VFVSKHASWLELGIAFAPGALRVVLHQLLELFVLRLNDGPPFGVLVHLREQLVAGSHHLEVFLG
jgi:hypothetical protein